MPELPEVETVRRGLEPLLTGRRVQAVEVGRARVVRRTSPEALVEGLRATRILGVERRGKYLLCPLDTGAQLMIHLRMSGQLLRAQPHVPRPAHTHVVLSLDDGTEVRFVDPRTFGEMVVCPPGADAELLPELARLGQDPLLQPVGPNDLARLWRGRRMRLKAFLLDQRFVAGIGNIYSDEIAHRAHLHPLTPVDRIGRSSRITLAAAIDEVLTAAVAEGGSTLGDAQYVDIQGRAGTYQERHRVYGRTGQPCRTCGDGVISQITVAQRSTHLCRRCQPQRRPRARR